MTELKGKGLFVFSDPGGAKAVLAQASLRKDKLDELLIISDREYSFYSDFELTVSLYNEYPEKIIKQFDPDFIFTGTSYTSKIELHFLKAAKNLGIKSVSFIDHWTGILSRFKYDDATFVFPSEVWVIDKRAKKLAKQEGVKVRLYISGNPYHYWLKKWKPTINKSDFYKQMEFGDIKNRLVVFAPDPLSNVGGKGRLGLDEKSVWRNLTEVLTQIPNKNYFIVVQLHPNQQKNNLFVTMTEHRFCNIFSGESTHVNTLLYHSDIVIGMFSNILLESAIMGKKIIRCLEGLTIEDPLAGMDVGHVVTSAEELKTELIELLDYGTKN